jgi:hypothetical protein
MPSSPGLPVTTPLPDTFVTGGASISFLDYKEGTEPLLSTRFSEDAPAPSEQLPRSANVVVNTGGLALLNPLWRSRDFTVREKLCFVLMPFKDTFRPVYDDHIKPVVTKLGLDCKRSDDIYGTRSVMEDIWEQICQARILIAELTGQNANVFYELGIAHTVGKSVILIAQSEDDVPFDLRHLRHITYDTGFRGVIKLQEQLETTLRAELGINP